MPGVDRAQAADTPEKYPLTTELKVLERDLSNSDYRTVLATMIPTDLAAEWQRIATSDNYLAFAEQHGGREKVLADPALRAAYEKRKQIADSFLAMIREAYAKRHIKPAFDKGNQVELALRSVLSQKDRPSSSPTISVKALMPAEGAERQWPRLRGPDGQGTADEATLPLHWSPTENVAWKVAIAGRGNSSPVVWNDRIFITSAAADGSWRKILCYCASRRAFAVGAGGRTLRRQGMALSQEHVCLVDARHRRPARDRLLRQAAVSCALISTAIRNGTSTWASFPPCTVRGPVPCSIATK